MEYIGMAILVIATIAVIAIPIVRADDTGEEPLEVDLTLAKIEEEKESAYNALKEAEFDYKTGKLSDEDYQSIKEKYSAKAVEALQKLEEYEKQLTVDGGQLTVEKEIKETSLKRTGHNFCSGCGAQLPKDAQFCGECGRAIAS